MKDSIYQKLKALQQRFQKLNELLSKTEIISDQNKFRDLSKEFSQLEPVINCFNEYTNNQEQITEAEKMLGSDDKELQELAEEEINNLREAQKELELNLKTLLLPKDPDDERNIFLEVRAGTGGQEAALFAADLFRMYAKFAENKKWQVEIINSHDAEQGGYKELIAKISGKDVYSQLKFESGAHRVQRVPVTESQGRIHTSACTVAVFPEMTAVDSIDINPADLRIDTYRSSGAGGQHVNTTDSAVRITHVPTGTVVECQDERSQHKNKAKAMSLLQAKILEHERTKQRQQVAETRRNLVGSGDRSERIRTYNFPQGRITDHRINLTLYKLTEILEGYMQELIDALIREHQADQLAALND
ncbi:MAG: peptide chain release factor 1 [Gammaproteobacteria bacterium]|nr:peptide chain release factor 1 [Gammaproteobacteria bacterium]